MTFPATYNISYYYGDTYEFRVFPKSANGRPFDLGNFDTVKFTLAPTRGADLADQISCYAAVSSDNTNVLCTIRPEDSENLDPTIQYVYDVEVTRATEPYDIVYTFLTGNVTITRDVTMPETAAPEELPDNPTNLVIGTITDTTIDVSWTAPTTGGDLDSYKIAIIPYTTSSSTIETAIQNSTTTISSSNSSYTFFGLTENTQYSLLILSTNATGDASYSSVLTNSSPVTTADNPNTVEPDFVVTNDGSSAYLIDGISNDTITVIRGETYVISVDATGHPFWIQTAPGYDSEDEYSTGVANNGTDNGNITWTVAESAPNTLFYACQYHSSMGGVITVINGES